MQLSTKRHILLTRTEWPSPSGAPNGLDVQKNLEEAGFKVSVEPLLHIHPQTISPEQAQSLQQNSAQAVLFTSVHAIQQWVSLRLPLDIPALTVGDDSTHIAKSLGFHQVNNADGNATELLAMAQKQLRINGGRVIYACGRVTSLDITEELKKLGFQSESLVLYDSQSIDKFQATTAQKLESGAITDLTFFSSRAADTFAKLVTQNHRISKACRKIRVFCLSDSIAQKIGHLPWASIHISAKPNLSSLLQLITAPLPISGERPMHPKDKIARLLGFTSFSLVLLMIAIVLIAPQLLIPSSNVSQPSAILINDLAKTVHELQTTLKNHQQSIATIQDAFGKLDQPALNNRLSEIDQRLSALSTEMNSYRNLSADAPIHDPMIGQLQQQISELSKSLLLQEKQISNFNVAIGDLDQVRLTLQQVGKQLELFENKLGQLPSLTTKVFELQQLSTEFNQQLQQLHQNPQGNQNPSLAALFLTAGQLETAINNGQPFFHEIAAIEQFGGQQSMVRDWLSQANTLKPWFETGIPSYVWLQQELKIIANKISQGILSDELRNSGWNQQFADQFSGLITIRPIGAQTQGDDLLSRLARTEAKLANGEWQAALKELDVSNLPKSLVDWKETLQAKLQANSLLQQFKNMLLTHFMTNP